VHKNDAIKDFDPLSSAAGVGKNVHLTDFEQAQF
jgi:hypothetical protein